MTVLVTGATGLVGNNVVRHLVETMPGVPVRCLVRESSDRRPLSGLPVETFAGDITDELSVRRAVEGATAVIHSAAMVRIGWTGESGMRRVNVEGTANIAEACRKSGVRLLLVSTVDTMRPADLHSVPYVATKIAAEAVIRAEIGAGLDAVIVRPAFVLGPNDWKPSSGRVLLAAGAGWVPFAPRGDTSICDARDVAAAILAALGGGRTGGSYVLGGHDMSWIAALRLFARAGNAWPPLCRFDPVAQRKVGLAGDLAAKLGFTEPAVNSAAMRLAGDKTPFDSSAARAELGYANRPLAETVGDAWNWFRDHGFVNNHHQ